MKGEVAAGKKNPRGRRAVRTSAGVTQLLEAAYGGDLAAVDQLLTRRVPVDASDEEGMTALHIAAMMGHVAILERLVAAGAGVDAVDLRERQTALMRATGAGHADAVESLIAAGADAEAASSEDGRTALIHAVTDFFASDRPALIRLLVAAGAEVNAADVEKRTALIHAAAQDLTGLEAAARALLELGAALDLRDREGNTALMHAVYRAASPHAMPWQREQGERIAAVLRGAGAVRDGLWNVELLHASARGSASEVESALDAGANVDHSVFGRFALLEAVAECCHQVVELLLARDADANRPREGTGETALMRAAALGDADGVRILLAAGADPDLRSALGETAASKAHGAARDAILALL